MMTRAERVEQRQKMMAMQAGKEWRAYIEQYRTRMAERARERARTPPGEPRQDPCQRLQP